MLLLQGHKGPVHTLSFAPDGTVLASASRRDPRIWLWDLSTGRASSTIEHSLSIAALAFAPTAPPTLAWSDGANRVTVWDLTSKRARPLDVVASFRHQSVRLTFSSDGQTLAGTGIGNATDDLPVYYRPNFGVTVWHCRGPEVVVEQTVPCRYSIVTSLAFSPNGRLLLLGCLDRTVRLWDLSSQRALHTLTHGAKVHAVAWSPDGRTFASASPNGMVKVWDGETAQKKKILWGGNVLSTLAYTPDGRLAAASSDGTVRLWDIATGRQQAAFDWRIGPLDSLAFAPDGMRAAAGGERDVLVWDLED
jgi:WD40 repeat protein